ncbi:MAG: transposase [Balneolaceae bacterium]|nr:transposase [Balneolaceae bacterium]
MNFTKVQLQTLIGNHIQRENGLNEVLEMTLNALMKAERREHLAGDDGDKGNGYRPGKVYGNGKLLELRIPRDRDGNFYPKVLTMLRAQQAETDRMVSALYGKGLTQSQIGDVFDELYGRHYSSSSISRMIDWMREEVGEWLARPLEAYYPIVFIDAIHVKVRRETVSTEAFYVIMGVTPERRREVLGIAHAPSESATGWGLQFEELKKRGVQKIGLMVADGISGLGDALSENFSGYPSSMVHNPY